MTDEKQKTPYEEGVTAFFRGQDLDYNPYGEFNERADEWDDGWYDAKQEETGRVFG